METYSRGTWYRLPRGDPILQGARARKEKATRGGGCIGGRGDAQQGGGTHREAEKEKKDTAKRSLVGNEIMDVSTGFGIDYHHRQVQVMSTLPLKAVSRIWGRFNELEIPYYLRVPGFKLYSWIFGVK